MGILEITEITERKISVWGLNIHIKWDIVEKCLEYGSAISIWWSQYIKNFSRFNIFVAIYVVRVRHYSTSPVVLKNMCKLYVSRTIKIYSVNTRYLHSLKAINLTLAQNSIWMLRQLPSSEENLGWHYSIVVRLMIGCFAVVSSINAISQIFDDVSISLITFNVPLINDFWHPCAFEINFTVFPTTILTISDATNKEY